MSSALGVASVALARALPFARHRASFARDRRARARDGVTRDRSTTNARVDGRACAMMRRVVREGALTFGPF